MQPPTERNLAVNAPDPEKSNRQKGAVGQRIITSIVAIPIVLVFVWFGGWWAFAASALLVVLGINELHTMMIHEGYHPVVKAPGTNAYYLNVLAGDVRKISAINDPHYDWITSNWEGNAIEIPPKG